MYKGDRDGVGTLCSPNCQLAYSFYRIDSEWKAREPWIRAQHRGSHYIRSPAPFIIGTIDRNQWFYKKKKHI